RRVPHDDVGARVGVGEEPVEVGAHRVAQHEGAGQERNAEEHREERPEEAALVREQFLQCEGAHAAPPSRRIRSSTSPAVGSARSSTMRPSARNTTRSAYPAATGSWVTITMVWPKSRTACAMKPSISAPERESR